MSASMCNAIKFFNKEVTGMSSSKREEEVRKEGFWEWERHAAVVRINSMF